MAEEQSRESVLGGLRSRLPKFLNERSSQEIPDSTEEIPSVANTQLASESGVPSGNTPSHAMRKKNATQDIEKTVPTDSETNGGAVLSLEESHLQHLQYLVEEFGQVQTEMQRMYQLVEDIAERESAQEKVFNTLHAELRDYKNDFIYEHLKPVIRPLLFLYDSLEQFDAEIALYERPSNGERRQVGLSPLLVRENISFFRDQLVEALRICEVTPMESPKGAFNARLHKVIDVVPVDEKQDGVIQRVVRSGWYLNGQLLRSAEVIVGKKMA